MPDRLAIPEDVGRPCPYCRFPLKEGAPAHACDSCGSVHHAECWGDGGGCAVFGCAAAGTAAPTAPVGAAPATQAYAPVYQGAPAPAYPPSAPAPPYPEPHQPPYQQPPQSSGTRSLTIAVAALIVVLGIVAGVAVASGAFSSGSHHTTVVTVKEQNHAVVKARGAMTPTEEQKKRQAIAEVLGNYQTDYSNHSLSGLGSIFAQNVKRHGLSATGCSEVQGKQAVLEDYDQQFNEGSGTYRLIGFNADQVRLHGPYHAEVHSHYEISPGGAGFVNFKFAEAAPEWKISEVYATCA